MAQNPKLNRHSGHSTKGESSRRAEELLRSAMRNGFRDISSTGAANGVSALVQHNLLIIIRGMPGSGKTTLAEKIAKKVPNAKICNKKKFLWTGGEPNKGVYVETMETVR